MRLEAAIEMTNPKMAPVNLRSHQHLTKNGYKWKANFEPVVHPDRSPKATRSTLRPPVGRFGYYEHPVTGHKITVDEMGNIQNQEEPKMQKGKSGASGFGGGAGGAGNGGGGSAFGNGMRFGGKCPHCGSSKHTLMPTDFETAKCSACGKNFDINAGGPGSGNTTNHPARGGAGISDEDHQWMHKALGRLGYKPTIKLGNTQAYSHSTGAKATLQRETGRWSHGPSETAKMAQGRGLQSFKEHFGYAKHQAAV